jgi:alpha-beta hydrolase superfamily lysophospholipase/serine/threonine protein kinase
MAEPGAAPPEPEFQGSERFRVQRRLGSGGFGVVYEAFDHETGSLVALKTLRRVEPEALYRFKQEFRALADVAHPNLVRLYELLREGDQWFFTMELIDGVSFIEYVRGPSPAAVSRLRTASGLEPPGPVAPPLSQAPTRWPEEGRLPGPTLRGQAPTGETPVSAPSSWEIEFDAAGQTARPRLDPRRLRRALRQVVEGVSALHAAGKLHRDLKPSNVLVTREGRALVLDFGLVQDVRAPGAAVYVAGTPEYMSPEQGAGEPLGEASDWYAVGVMLYQALTGAVPFSGPWTQVLRDKQRLDPRPPAARVPGVPADLEALCLALLRVEPQARPGGEEILRRLGGASDRPPLTRAVPARAALVGREPHLARLLDAFETARAGRSVSLALHGGSGLGKTALLQHFVERLRWSEKDAAVIVGRCYEHESVPYKALDDLVDRLTHHLAELGPQEVEALLPDDAAALARLFPVLRQIEAVQRRPPRAQSPDPQEQRRRAFAALRELLRRLAARRPLVLAIDDVQWGDADSAALLFEVFRDPDPPAALLVTAYRSEEAEASPFLAALGPLTRTAAWGAEPREMVVGELDPGQARALALELGAGALQAGGVEAVVREAAGSPFFIGELVRYLQTQAGPGAAPSALPEVSLHEMILLRVSRLDPETRRLLDVVSVAGRPIATRVARHAARVRAEEVDPFARLRSEHLVRTRGSGERERVEAYHDRIREAVVEALSGTRLSRCHLALGLALEAWGRADAETLALHFRAGGDRVRARAYAVRAAEHAAEALAFERAAWLYRAAFDLHPEEGPERQRLRVALADALAGAGRGPEAARLYLEAVTQAPPAEWLELRRRAAQAFLISGHIQEGFEVLRVVLGELDLPMARTPRGALVSFLLGRARAFLRGTRLRARPGKDLSPAELVRIDTCWSVAVGLALVDPIQGSDFQTRHLLLALRAGDPYRVARALAMEVTYSAVGGTRARERTDRLLGAARTAAARVAQPHAEGMVWLVHGMARYLEGHWAEAVETLERADAILRERCAGVFWELDTVQMLLLRARIYLGGLGALARRLPALVREARQRGDLLALIHLGTDIVYMAELADDKPEQARKGIAAHLQRWGTDTFDIQHDFALHGAVEVDLYDGRPAEAWARLELEWPRLAGSLNLRVQLVRIHAWDFRARAAVAMAAAAPRGSREREAFLRRAERDARAIEREHTHWGAPLAALVRAGTAAARGRGDEARTRLQAALRGFREADMRLHAEITRRRLGELAGDDAGRAEVDAAERWMLGEGIRRPARFARMLAPGPWEEIGARPETAPQPGPRRAASTLRAADGLRLHVESWLPVAGAPRAAVMLVHGFAEHVGRYAHVAAHLAARGHAVFGYDQRTHGRSEGRPRVYLPDLEPVLADLAAVCAHARRAAPGAPLYLYGHSMGAFVALAHALRHQDGLAGLITSGVPLLLDSALPQHALRAARLVARVAPTLPLVPLDLDGVSRDPAVVAAYKADPLVHAGRVRARMAVVMSAALAALRERVAELRLPLLILHGGADPTAPPAGSEWLHAHAGSSDKTLRIFPGLYHEVHNEPEREQVLAEIAAWLDARTR